MRITVFTPTYNREYVIENLYRSLQRQSLKDFEWIVIDDGSTDDTETLFQSFLKEENIFPIIYKKIPNGGKHRAINKGLEMAQGELFFIVDSDDYLTDDALKKINDIEKSIPNEKKRNYAGVCGLRGYDVDKMIGTTFKGDILDISTLERVSNGVTGDKSEVFYTDILKKYPFPEFENEKFVTECVVWDHISYDGYKLRFFNDIIYICHYLPDGLTSKYQQLLNNSPKGYGLYLYQSSQYKKIVGFNKWMEFYKYYNYQRNKISFFEIAKNLNYNTFFLYLRILGMKIFFKLYDKWE